MKKHDLAAAGPGQIETTILRAGLQRLAGGEHPQ
jgi:hypothetical protein